MINRKLFGNNLSLILPSNCPVRFCNFDRQTYVPLWKLNFPDRLTICHHDKCFCNGCLLGCGCGVVIYKLSKY